MYTINELSGERSKNKNLKRNERTKKSVSEEKELRSSRNR